MHKGWVVALAVVAVAGAGAWVLTAPAASVPEDAIAALTPDPAHGEQVFLAGGCASCHTAPGAVADGPPVLSGGQEFPSEFGTFVAPNISPDPVAGIGGWSARDLANAMLHGVSPKGQHYYPAFPYASYARASLQDIVDLRAHLATLPASSQVNASPRLGFPFNLRRGVGVWKLLYLNPTGWMVEGELTPEENRGRYLVEALGHCGECHTPRTPLGGMERSHWLGGAPSPDGKGRVPNITPGQLRWSTAEIVEYLTTGFTPDYDTVGGHMASVVANFARLPQADRAAVAAYLKKVPAIAPPPAPAAP